MSSITPLISFPLGAWLFMLFLVWLRKGVV
jgi:hypothetical protein